MVSREKKSVIFNQLFYLSINVETEAAMGIKVNAQLENTEYIQDVHKWVTLLFNWLRAYDF